MKATKSVWVGRVFSGLFILFMVGASIVPKIFMQKDVSIPSMVELGWPPKYLVLIAAIEIVGTVLYAIPRTSLLGAIWMTGLLGGAMATQIRVESPLYTHILFSVYLGLFMWVGLWLRDPKLKHLLPIRTSDKATTP